MRVRGPMRIGILGGGQLARMLAEQAHRLGLTPVVYAEAPDAPAAQVTPATIIGSLMDEERLRSFLRQADVVTFENEFVDTDLLLRAADGDAERFIPSLDSIRTLQDKLGQKHLLESAGVPASPFLQRLDDEEPERFAARARQAFGGPPVFKWSRMGYDAHGVLLPRDAAVDGTELDRFMRRGSEKGGVTFAEKRIDLVRELAMVCTVSRERDFVFYPLVVNEQEHGICRHVYGPASAFGVPAELEPAAREACRKVAEAAGLTGTFAIEFFETREETLLVNEIAPRVHNSGHYTQNACSASQFENHIRAVTGLPVIAPQTAPAFAMLNILGPEGSDRDAEGTLPPVPGPSTHVHWYGKSRIKTRRKLGHLNASASSVEALRRAVGEMWQIDRDWCASVSQPKETS